MRAIKVYESSLYDFDEDEIVNDMYVKLLLTNSFDEELFIYTYKNEESIDNNTTDEEILNSDNFVIWLKNKLQNMLEDVKYDIQKIIDDSENIHIYRIMMVNDNWFNDLQNNGKRLGIFWSYEKKCG
jgi:hypothetical protein